MRITPAYAGKSRPQLLRFDSVQDHPRLCGEKLNRTALTYWRDGSPPPMRGKARPRRAPDALHGITPAYAGKSCRCCRCSSCVWDHPRLCGEKAASVSPSSTSVGSPPPMRGKGEYTEEATKQSGITPAYAGKSRKTGRFSVPA